MAVGEGDGGVCMLGVSIGLRVLMAGGVQWRWGKDFAYRFL